MLSTMPAGRRHAMHACRGGNAPLCRDGGPGSCRHAGSKLRLCHRRRRFGGLRAGQSAERRCTARGAAARSRRARRQSADLDSDRHGQDARVSDCTIGAITPSRNPISTTAASTRCAARSWAARPRSTSWPIRAAIRAITTAGRRNGATGWSYADVLPYFQRCETWEGGENQWRGGTGPLGTQWAKTTDPLFDAWIEAGEGVRDIPLTPDYNGEQQEGFGRGQYTIRDGRRSSTARAYLRPARKRDNLTSRPTRTLTRVRSRGNRATGVEYAQGGEDVHVPPTRGHPVRAARSTRRRLLMLSASGRPTISSEIGIDPSPTLPGRQEPAGSSRHLDHVVAPSARRRFTARCASTAWP